AGAGSAFKGAGAPGAAAGDLEAVWGGVEAGADWVRGEVWRLRLQISDLRFQIGGWRLPRTQQRFVPLSLAFAPPARNDAQLDCNGIFGEILMHPGLDISNKVCLVTGGTSGIGRAIALGYARAGAKVIAGSSSAEK